MAELGVDIPMGFERGYHMHYAPGGAENSLQRPIYDTAGGYVLSPMEQGLRLSTGVELNRCDAPMKPVQLDITEAAARQALPLGRRLEHPLWMGRRPTLPDSRPIIDEMPGRPGLWLAFGHQHIGFSTGPGTALLAAMMLGDKQLPMNPIHFAPAAFYEYGQNRLQRLPRKRWQLLLGAWQSGDLLCTHRLRIAASEKEPSWPWP